MEVFFVRDTNNPIIVTKFGRILVPKAKRDGVISRTIRVSGQELAFTFIRAIEKGKVNPSLATVEKIANALGMNISELFRLLQTEN